MRCLILLRGKRFLASHLPLPLYDWGSLDDCMEPGQVWRRGWGNSRGGGLPPPLPLGSPLAGCTTDSMKIYSYVRWLFQWLMHSRMHKLHFQ